MAGLLATAAFIAIFGVTGIAISSLGIGIAKFLPWVAVSSGDIIIGIGVAKAFGKTIHINIPSPRGLVYNIHGSHRSNDGKKPGYANFFLFGIGYSIASLSCTLPLFLLIVFQGLSAGGIVYRIYDLRFRNGKRYDCNFSCNKRIKPDICKMVKETCSENEFHNKCGFDTCWELFDLL